MALWFFNKVVWFVLAAMLEGILFPSNMAAKTSFSFSLNSSARTLLREGQRSSRFCEFCLLKGEKANDKRWKYVNIMHMKSLTFETKSLHSRNSHVDDSNLIPGSTQIRDIELNWFQRRSFHALNWRN